MANVLVNEQSLSDIAAAIREKNGEEATYKPGEMAAAINNLPTGGGGGNLQYVVLTPATTTTFDISNYVDGHKNFILYYGRKNNSQRMAFAPCFSDANLGPATATFVGSTGFNELIGTGGQRVFNTLNTSSNGSITYDETTGIITISGNSTLGNNAVLIYID